MTDGWFTILVVAMSAVLAAVIWYAYELRLARTAKKRRPSIKELDKAYTDIADEDIDHLFNKQFREELRNRGRLRFESVINENAMFLKHDLDLTISQLNQHMQQEISKHLEDEFAKYAAAMHDAQNLALDSLRKTAGEIEEQRQSLSKALKKEVDEREEALLKVYEDNMAQIVEHYVRESLGSQFDLKSQLPYIIEQMEANKKHIIEDMKL